MHKTFFTSDTHFNHANVLHYSNRPWTNVNEMNEALISNWNSVVKENDHVWHLGDFGMKFKASLHVESLRTILRRLNGKIHLIAGNHDKPIKTQETLEMFVNEEFLTTNKAVFNIQDIWIQDMNHQHGKQMIVLCHFPIESWHRCHYDSWHLHGHCHGNLASPEWQKRIDVGIDSVGQFMNIDPSIKPHTPIEYEQIKRIMKTRSFKVIDHHVRKRK